MAGPNEEFYFAAIREFEQGSLEGARAFVEKLSRLEPDSERAVILKALILEEDGQIPQAIGLLEDFTRKNLRSAHSRSNLARLQWRAGEHRRALMTLRISLAQEPNQERALRLFASMVESELSFKSAYDQLMMMAGSPKAWLPGWVAAELALTFGDYEQVESALRRALERRPVEFPTDRLLKILLALGENRAGRCWELARPYAPSMILGEFDERFLPRMKSREAPDKEKWTQGRLLGGVIGGLLARDKVAASALSTVRLIGGEILMGAEMMGRLERGLALLLAELLLIRFGVVAELSFPLVAEEGFVDEKGPTSGELLKARHGSEFMERLVSLYLSVQKSGEFVLDAELYDRDGVYLGRCASRGAGPEEALADMTLRLGEFLPSALDPRPYDGWESPLSLTHALAREVAAAFVLCGEGAMSIDAIQNPGFSLELLTETAIESGSAADLLALLAALRGAAYCRVETAEEQRALLERTLERDPGLAGVLSSWPSAGPPRLDASD